MKKKMNNKKFDKGYVGTVLVGCLGIVLGITTGLGLMILAAWLVFEVLPMLLGW